MPNIRTTGQKLILAGGFKNHERVVEVDKNQSQDIPELFTDQEEADSRIFLHVHDSIARYGIRTAIIHSPDSDVLVLGS